MNRATARLLAAACTFVLGISTTYAADPKPRANATPAASEAKYDDTLFSGLELRGIGPALTSGRIADLAVDPRDPRTWYVAVASGNLWKTTNAGTTFTPIFDDQASYSIGCVSR